MTRRIDQPRSGCAINAAVEVISDRWSLLVLRDVMFGNRRHFRVLQERSDTSRQRHRCECGPELLADDGPDLRDDFTAERRAEHLGAPLPPRSGPSTAERLAAACAAALAPETGKIQGNDGPAGTT